MGGEGRRALILWCRGWERWWRLAGLKRCGETDGERERLAAWTAGAPRCFHLGGRSDSQRRRHRATALSFHQNRSLWKFAQAKFLASRSHSSVHAFPIHGPTTPRATCFVTCTLSKHSARQTPAQQHLPADPALLTSLEAAQFTHFPQLIFVFLHSAPSLLGPF